MSPDAGELRNRNSREVLEDQVQLREDGRLDDDLARNSDPAVPVLSGREVLRGHQEVRRAQTMHYIVVSSERSLAALGGWAKDAAHPRVTVAP